MPSLNGWVCVCERELLNKILKLDHVSKTTVKVRECSIQLNIPFQCKSSPDTMIVRSSRDHIRILLENFHGK